MKVCANITNFYGPNSRNSGDVNILQERNYSTTMKKRVKTPMTHLFV